MNPVLIKPSTDSSAQVVVLGRVWGQVSAADYHQRRVEELFPIVVEAHRVLAAEHDVVLMEGAGSPAEINLKVDIVNMRMAQAANAACLLVGDIDRGGVFASLLGTVELLDTAERAMLRGFVVNKFRGDMGLLMPGIEMIEKRIQLPCAGVVAHLPDLGLEEEDSVALENSCRSWKADGHGPQRSLRVGVVKLPYMANFTDFDALAAEPSVSLAFLDGPEDLHEADLVILPGSKQTLDDLRWLRLRGFENAIRQSAGHAGVMGICGGMQMMGISIADPQGHESNGVPRTEPGLALLPIETILRAEKVTRVVRGRVCGCSVFGEPLATPDFQGYEIHLGETVYAAGAEPFAEIRRCGEALNRPDGAVSTDRRSFGTYVHGIFADDAFRYSFLSAARAACGLAPMRQKAFVAAEREHRIDRLAGHVRRALDMDLIHACLGVRS